MYNDPDASSNYWAPVFEARRHLPPGHVAIFDVLHDDWCGLLAGTGRYDCNPDVIVREVWSPGAEE
jgi:hypothetical protein